MLYGMSTQLPPETGPPGPEPPPPAGGGPRVGRLVTWRAAVAFIAVPPVLYLAVLIGVVLWPR